MARLLNHFQRRRSRLEHQLDRELRYHLDRRIADLMAAGATESEARRRANLELGGITQVQDAVRDTWVVRWVDLTAQDLRHAIRSLTRARGFAVGAGLVLALAIGANTAIFTVVNAVLLRPLPYPESDRIVSIETLWTNAGRLSQDVSGPDFLDWQQQNRVFQRMAVWYGEDDVATIVGERPVFANDRYVSADFFNVFGQQPSAGRLLTAQDVPVGEAEPTVVVLAHHWATTHFGSAEAAVGVTIKVYGLSFEVVGVAAPGFRYPGAGDLWIPWRTENGGTDRSVHNYQAVARLAAGVSFDRAQGEMRAIGEALASQYPENRLKSVVLVPLHERVTGNLRTTLWILMAAALIVLLIACANLGSLSIARMSSRAREIALRAALGSGRGRVVRQLLTESVVLTAAAAVVGLALAQVFVPALLGLSPVSLARAEEVRIDGTVLLYILGLSTLATMVFGLLPAVHAARFDLIDALKQGARGVVSATGTATRSTLVVIEVALSVILLVAAGLLLRSFQGLHGVDLGFERQRVLVAYTQFPVTSETERTARAAFYAEVLERLRSVPGVNAVAGVAFLPMGREPRPAREFFVQGRRAAPPGEGPRAEVYTITPGYFETLQIPLRAGRDFGRTDTPARPPVAIVNETLVRTAFAGESPLGRYVRWNSRGPWMEVIGVVADVRWQDPAQPAPAMIFASSIQGAGGSLSILVRTSLDEASLSATLRGVLRDANPGVPVRFETLDELFESALAYPRFRTRVIVSFAAVAALLAVVGLFSVLAYMVGQRSRELAVRRAIGATAMNIVMLIAGQGLRLVAIGLVIGVGAAVALARGLDGLLYDTSPWEVATYASAIAVLAVAAAVATLVPAMRAVSIPPVVVLQQE